MNRRISYSRLLLVWLIILVYLAGAAWVRREIYLDNLAERIVLELRQEAEHGKVENSMYLWWDGWQGPAVYLLERHRVYPEMERVLLLLEAKRPYDWNYLYNRCFNWDLREPLIEHCTEWFPDDAKVAWAAGRIYLTAGYYNEAAHWLKRAMELDLDTADLGVPEEHSIGRYVTALIMSGKGDKAEEFLAQQAAAHPDDIDRQVRYIEFLCTKGAYAETIELASAAIVDIRDDGRLRDVLRRAGLFSGDFDTFSNNIAYNDPYQGERLDFESQLLMYLLEKRFDMLWQLVGLPAPGFTVRHWDEAFKSLSIYRMYAEAYAATGDTTYLDYLRDVLEHVRVSYNASLPEDFEKLPGWQRHQIEREFSDGCLYLGLQIARGHILYGEWGEAREVLDSLVAPESWWDNATYDTAQLLTTIAEGGDIDGLEMDSLATKGTLPDLLISPYFRDALESGGRDKHEVLEEIHSAIKPDLWEYYDSSNGELDWE